MKKKAMTSIAVYGIKASHFFILISLFFVFIIVKYVLRCYR